MRSWGIDTCGINYWVTYSPVVNWISVCLLFALTMIHDLESCSIDFVLNFTQAKLKEDIYTKLPFGFDQEEYCGYIMKLKNLFMFKTN